MTKDISAPRKDWLDALRAVAIYLVVLGHLIHGHTGYYVFTSPVKLPLFFAVTGYLFRDPPPAFPAWLRNLARRLAVPWLAGVAISTAFNLAFGIYGGIGDLGRDLLGDPPLWYLPCLFFAEILWYFNRRVRGDLPLAALALAECVAGLLLARWGILDFMKLNTAMAVQPFLLLGWLYRRHESRISRLGWPAIAGLAAVYLAMGFISMRLWPGRAIDVHLNRYVCLPYTLAMIAAGCLALFMAFERAGRIPRAVVRLGQNTLLTYMLHSYVLAVLKRVYRWVGAPLPDVPAAMLLALLACAACVLISVPINRWLPELVGLRRRRG